MDDLIERLRRYVDVTDDPAGTRYPMHPDTLIAEALAHIASEPSRTAVAVGEERERCARIATKRWELEARRIEELGGGYAARDRAAVADQIRTAIRNEGSGE